MELAAMGAVMAAAVMAVVMVIAPLVVTGTADLG